MNLTTDHSSSSYNSPVLVDDSGQAYGPHDVLPCGSRASDYVADHPQCGDEDLRSVYLSLARHLSITPKTTKSQTTPSISCSFGRDIGIDVVTWGTMITSDYGHASYGDTPEQRHYHLYDMRARAIAIEYLDAAKLADWGAAAQWSWSEDLKSAAYAKIHEKHPGMGKKKAYNTGNQLASQALAAAEQYYASLAAGLVDMVYKIDKKAQQSGRTVWSTAVYEDHYIVKFVPYPTPEGANISPLITVQRITRASQRSAATQSSSRLDK